MARILCTSINFFTLLPSAPTTSSRPNNLTTDQSVLIRIIRVICVLRIFIIPLPSSDITTTFQPTSTTSLLLPDLGYDVPAHLLGMNQIKEEVQVLFRELPEQDQEPEIDHQAKDQSWDEKV